MTDSVTNAPTARETLLTVRGDDHLNCEADRFGAHPMYTVQKVDKVLVSTTLHELRQGGHVSGLDPERVRDHLIGDQSRPLMPGVQRVPPGSSLWVTEARAKIRSGGLFPREDLSRFQTRKALSGALLDRLGDVVDRQLGSNEPVVSLSGALDSTALLALVADRSPRAWTLISGPRDPTLKLTMDVAKEFGADHHVVEAKELDLPDSFVEAVEATETLLFNGRCVAKYLFQRVVAGHEKTLLSGAGADEVLMGFPAALRSAEGAPPIAVMFDADRRLIRKVLAEDFLPPEFETPGAMSMHEARDLTLTLSLPEHVLPFECRAAAALGMEVLLPYLDEKLSSFALGLGETDLIRDAVGKTVLREAWEGMIDDEIREAPRRPRFSPPGGGTAKTQARWAQLYEGVLSQELLNELPALDTLKVRRLIGAYAGETRRNHPGFAVMDRVLMRLASVAVLHRALS